MIKYYLWKMILIYANPFSKNDEKRLFVDCCNDGEMAMLYALNTDYGYDLAIVDRMLPVIDGLTIIKAMRRKNIQIPVIIITGNVGFG